ncbi:transposase [Streptomyces rubiginosohelvolus]|uniref:transposase n=1 Tax=Streptomyces TaxID=1883 RepID=UPI00211D4BEC|nr:transposase [Streptomyces sp. gb14]
MTDTQWARLELLLPRGRKPGRPPTWTRRQLIDGIRFRIRTGVPWRDIPERYGPWGRVYDLFRRWQRNGTWKRILADLLPSGVPRYRPRDRPDQGRDEPGRSGDGDRHRRHDPRKVWPQTLPPQASEPSEQAARSREMAPAPTR